jgi:LysM repeat protein
MPFRVRQHPAPLTHSSAQRLIALIAMALVFAILLLLVGGAAPADSASQGALTHQVRVPQVARDAGPESASTYTVQRGDTLFSIARRFNTTVGVLVLANHLPNRNVIATGQVLAIPDAVGRTGLGYDISWPQCGGAYPTSPFAFAVIGINHHDPFTQNGCLGDELAWARQGSIGPMLYMNAGAPPDGYQNPACGVQDQSCLHYQYGFAAANYSFGYANAFAPDIPEYWLDVESFNRWSADTALNTRVIQGMIDALQGHGKTVGIYSTNFQFTSIAGGFAPGLPNWIPGVAHQPADGPSACLSAKTFGGGFVAMVQWTMTYDGDFLC